MNICLYSSFEKGVKYIATPDGNPNPAIRKIGELNVDIPNPDNLPREQRRVELTMDLVGLKYKFEQDTWSLGKRSIL